MNNLGSRRPSAAMVIACLALFLALGGSVYAAKSSGGKKINGTRIKQNSVPGNRIQKHTLTGTQIDFGKLGTVPSASNATNAANASSAANATTVDSVKTFSAGASDNQLVSLAKTSSFELMGICDPNFDFDPPGVQFENTGTAMVIYNRGTAPAFSDTEDDVDYNLTQGQGVVFNYEDNGDGGAAMSTDGHFMMVPGWGNLVADTNFVNRPSTSDDYPFSTDCHFAGAVEVG
ncbi:MAG TPA: hypothetical protein VH476_09925 [Solirubrobacterales bacterium]|jgi:hypothetical protein